MIYEHRKAVMKNGEELTFRTPDLSEAEKCLKFITRVAGQTRFLSSTATDCAKMTVDDEHKWLKSCIESKSKWLIATYDGDREVASADICIGIKERERHTATVGICIDADYWNMGIGSFIFEEFFRIARENKVEVIMLNMVDDNVRARALYNKFGFKQYGIIPKWFKIGENYYDMAVMVAEVKGEML